MFITTRGTPVQSALAILERARIELDRKVIAKGEHRRERTASFSRVHAA